MNTLLLCPGELVGFSVPDWMIEKMKAYIETARTHPDTSDEELLRMAEEYAEMEEERRGGSISEIAFNLLLLSSWI